MLINHRRPIRLDDEWQGMLFSTLTIQGLSELVAELGNVFETTAFILSGRDRILAHPSLVNPPPEQSAKAPLVGLSRVGDPVLASIRRGRDLGLIEATHKRVKTVGVDLGDHQYIVIYREFQGYGAMDLGRLVRPRPGRQSLPPA